MGDQVDEAARAGMQASVEAPIAGWGRFPKESCHLFRPERAAELLGLVASPPHGSIIARGLGRSYGDAAVNGGADVLLNTRRNRMLKFDRETGLLECESGVSLGELLEVFVPRGYFLPVTPGTKFVTVGGAIANDVHGKNHHRDGTFGQWTRHLHLLTPAGEIVRCSPNDNADVFWATVGGIGLTGYILSACIELRRIESAWISVDYYRARDLDDVIAAIDADDHMYQYSVAWVDCLARGSKLGRSVLMRGNHAPSEAVSRRTSDPLRITARRSKNVPFNLPEFILNPLSIGAFNAMYYGFHGTKSGQLVDYDTYFYPLDAIHNWNRMYGKRGFTQYQATVPLGQTDGLREILERLSASRRASFLGVLKRFGEANPGLLSHPFAGYTLTLDIPFRDGLTDFLHELDRVLLDCGGRLYTAKDVCATAATFAAMYPRLEEFRAIKARLDPGNRLSSRMARRLGIVEEVSKS